MFAGRLTRPGGLGISRETKEQQLQKKKRVRLEEEDPEA